tara:strand:+ start:187 stop:651 length:465 start_codon:yes stop_codon:yes gene_type:complete
MPDHQQATVLLSKIFKKTLAADVEILSQTAERIYRDTDRGKVTKNDYKVVGVTSDNRVAELIEEVASFVGADLSKPENFDMVVYVLGDGSPDYLEWVKNQTEPLESAESAFEDVNAADMFKETFDKAPIAGAMLNTKVEETSAGVPNIKVLQES